MARQGPSSAFESETFGQDASFRLEQPVGSMSISPSGRDVALASKEGLHIIDLDSPYSPPRYLPHRTPWEVADVQWSPFAARDYWVVSTSNQKALVWNLDARSWQDPIEFVLHGHTRAITDINFSAHNPDVLATCAVDSFVHCWDLRIPSRPVNSFSDWFAGATQVKWNRQDEHVIASSHDKFLHIWDDRKGAYPVRTVEAHGTKIYGIDWNRHHHHKIVTCSLDRTIKFWDCEGDQNILEREIDTPFPVWRARYTPFGWGLLAMPQRGNSDLHLYDRRAVHGTYESGHVNPVATFKGHEGQVKEFLWRARGSITDSIDHRDFQLVSWGTDRELKLHAVEPDMYADIGFEKGISKVQRLNFTRRGAVYKTFRDIPGDADSPVDDTPQSDVFPRHSHPMPFRPRNSTSVGMNKIPVAQFRGWVQGGRHTQKSGMHGRGNIRQSADPISWLKNVKISSWDPDTLAEEIRHVGEKFKKVEFETVDISHRKAVMSLQAPWGEDQSQVFLRLEMRFPKLYPGSANAVLTLQKSGFLNDERHRLIATELHTIAETYASRKRGCLEAILRYLLREQNLEQIVAWVLEESPIESRLFEASTVLEADDSSDSDDDLDGVREGLDASANILVPIAKGCGALWSESGKLVCFFPAKGNEPMSFLNTLGVKDLDDSQSSRLFEGFGRLQTSSARKTTLGAKTADGDSDSETSESSWNSSSSASSSYETEHHDRGVSAYKLGVSGLQQRSRSPDRSNHSTTGGGTKLNDAAPRTSAVSLHTFNDLIPSRRDLAVDYQTFGDSQEVCKHNARVARNASLDDLVSIWTLMGLVLDDRVPLEVVSDLSHTSSMDVSIIARAALKKPGHQHSTIGGLGHEAHGRTRWGNHPLGSTYLMPAIFDHFERLADVQMLAMLACILSSSLNYGALPGKRAIKTGVPAPAISPLVRNDYFPSRRIARSVLRKDHDQEGYVLVESHHIPSSPGLQPSSGAENQRRPYHSLGRHGSQFSSRAASFVADDDGSPLSTAVSVSTSPEGNRLSHKSVSSIAYSTARASLSALTHSYSNSPPNHSAASGIASSLKKYSPSGSLAPNWVSSGLFGVQSISRASRTPIQHDDNGIQDSRDTGNRSFLSTSAVQGSRKGSMAQSSVYRQSARSNAETETSGKMQKKKSPKHKRLRTRLLNQDCFDLDGYPPTPLLDPVMEQKCRLYRENYAQLLDVWQLPIQRAEMLKLEGVSAADVTVSHKHQGSNAQPSGLDRPRRKTLTSTSPAADHGLGIRRCCRNCGTPLAPIEKNGVPIGWHCVSPACLASNPASGGVVNKVPERSACAVCNSSIKGLAVPCLQCGHMTCYDCAQGWFGADRVQAKHKPDSRRSSDKSELSPIEDNEDEDLEDHPSPAQDEHTTCPTGCGCPCATLAAITVPHPPIPTRSPEASIHTGNTQTGEQDEHLTPPQLTQQPSRSSIPATLPRSSSLLIPQHSSDNSPDGALAAILALTQSHQRSKSVHLAGPRVRGASSAAAATAASVDPQTPNTYLSLRPSQSRPETETATDLALDDNDNNSLNPFAGMKIATLGRGTGPGLSRGLSSKTSDSTIRKAK